MRYRFKEGGVVLLQFITRRLLYLIPSLLGIVLITFILSRVLPGDPALMIAGEQAPQQVVENIRAQLGLNEPLYVQFGAYLKQLAQGDLGIAWAHGTYGAGGFLCPAAGHD